MKRLMLLSMVICVVAPAAHATDFRKEILEFATVLDPQYLNSLPENENALIEGAMRQMHAQGLVGGIVSIVGMQGGYLLGGDFHRLCLPEDGISVENTIRAIQLFLSGTLGDQFLSSDWDSDPRRFLVLASLHRAYPWTGSSCQRTQDEK